MADQRRGGIITVTTNGVRYDAKGDFTYNLGRPKRKALVGSDGVHGYVDEPQPAFIEGKITDRGSLDLDALVTMKDASVMLDLGVGKVVALRDAWYAAEGTGNSAEGEIDFRFEGLSAEEVS
jgi:hypothetical protein